MLNTQDHFLFKYETFLLVKLNEKLFFVDGPKTNALVTLPLNWRRKLFHCVRYGHSV